MGVFFCLEGWGKMAGDMTKVAMITGEHRRKMVREAIDQLGPEAVARFRGAKQILIQANLVHHELQLASTHVDAVRGILDQIRIYTDAPVIIADGAHYGTKAGFRNFGYENLLEQYVNVGLADLNDEETFEQALDEEQTTVVRRPKLVRDCDLRIAVTPMKTHHEYGVSLSVSSWAEATMIVPSRVGAQGRVWSRAPWLAAQGDEATHRLLANLFEKLPCHMAIIDGILAMEGEGPVEGTAVPMGVVLASLDPIAADTVAVNLMGFDPHAIGYLELLAQKEAGNNDMSKIDLPPVLLLQLTKTFSLPVTTKQRLWQH